MLQIVQVLKRKDAASVVVAVVVALILSQLLPSLTDTLVRDILGIKHDLYGSNSSGFKEIYLYPLFAALFQLILLEVGIRVYTAVATYIARNKR
jgi:hypothetical protein